MPWLALPFANRDVQAAILENFEISEIPCFLLIDGKTGKLMTKDGKTTVLQDLERFKNPLLESDSW